MPRLLSLCAVVPVLLAVSAAAQGNPGDAPPDSALVEIVLDDGSRFVGAVVRETEGALVLETAGGATVTVEKARIRRRRLFEGRVEGGRIVRDDPNHSRLLFAPTARPIHSGRGYVAAYEVFFPFVAYGVGDALSLAGGVTLFPTSELQLVYAAPKVTLAQTEASALAAGVLVTFPFGGGETDFGPAGIAFGVGTFGSPQQAVTVGAGYGFVRAEHTVFDSTAGPVQERRWSGQPLLMLGGETQVSNSVKLLSENYLLTYEGDVEVDPLTGLPVGEGGTEVTFLVSAGVRFFGERLAADLALFTSPDLIDASVPFVPWVGFAYNF